MRFVYVEENMTFLIIIVGSIMIGNAIQLHRLLLCKILLFLLN